MGKRQKKAADPAADNKIEESFFRIIIKFVDDAAIPFENGAECYIRKLGYPLWSDFIEHRLEAGLDPLLQAIPQKQVLAYVATAKGLDPAYSPPNLLAYFTTVYAQEQDAEASIAHLQKCPLVEFAYIDQPSSDSSTADPPFQRNCYREPTGNPHYPDQGYLSPAPIGIDCEFTWPRSNGDGLLGGSGEGINFIDLERGWTLDHEDLVALQARRLYGDNRDDSNYHGTRALGVVCADNNDCGCIGIAYCLNSVNVVSYYGTTRPDAILAAISHLGPGDVLLLEAEINLRDGGGKYPIEILRAEFDLIRLATALQIIVIEAAGNGSNDLDAYTTTIDGRPTHILNRDIPAEFRDSLAIMVGMAKSAVPRYRKTSNYGSRVDCFAWGENVWTCDSNAAGATDMYTETFRGTSSASAIIAGAAAVVQGVAVAKIQMRFSPRRLRAILSCPCTGTPSADPPVDRIGVMPDLRKIMRGPGLNIAPDIYVRDNIGDTGETPHQGTLSSSPDIIAVRSPIADPQAALGEGSGTENRKDLGDPIHAGHDYSLYVRIRNRGGTEARNVSVTVYWSEASTLVTSDLWTLIGTTVAPAVPAGGILTVSPSITWPQAEIPGAGHYCFVAIIGNTMDPAPALADFRTWELYRRYIRDNNNVAWRNFNVVDSEPDPVIDPDYILLAFVATGFPDLQRNMQLSIVSRLPPQSIVHLDSLSAFDGAKPLYESTAEGAQKTGWWGMQVNYAGATSLATEVFEAGAKRAMRLRVNIPADARKHAYEISVRQSYSDTEIGRITWRLQSPLPDAISTKVVK